MMKTPPTVAELITLDQYFQSCSQLVNEIEDMLVSGDTGEIEQRQLKLESYMTEILKILSR